MYISSSHLDPGTKILHPLARAHLFCVNYAAVLPEVVSRSQKRVLTNGNVIHWGRDPQCGSFHIKVHIFSYLNGNAVV
jgi:hypothetical protein